MSTRPRSTSPAAATVADVARLAGVSAMTVSRVVNGDPGVRPERRQAVQAAIAALNYRPNPAARRLAGRDLVRLGVLCPHPGAGYLSALLVGLLGPASLAHVQLIVEPGGDHTDPCDTAGRLIAAGVDGLILAPPLCDAPELIALIARQGLPAVAVASGRPDARLNAVGIDERAAAAEMTRHLLALGHRRIGFIGGDAALSASALRLQGHLEALAEAGLARDESLLAQGRYSYRSGLDAAEALLADPAHRPSAVFASNDDMAAATVAVAHRLGLDVPGDLTVAGFDDTAIATTIWPELTTIHQPIAQMAERAVALLVQQVRGRAEAGSAAPAHERLPHTLVRRQSDAAPRRRPAPLPASSPTSPTSASTAAAPSARGHKPKRDAQRA
jgi:LacI family transcriptional regulator